MIPTDEKLAKKQRKILGPLGRLLLKLFRWEIKGKIPDLEKMILIGIPHTAMRDAWYALLACLLYTSPSPRDAHESRMPSSA